MVKIFGWSHRAMKRNNGEFAIVETYFDEEGNIEGWTVDNIAPVGDDLDELRWTLEEMLKACDKPVLIEEELDRHGKDGLPE